GFDQSEQAALDGIEQRVLLDQIVDGIAGQAELGEDRDRGALVMAGARRSQNRGGIGGGVGDAAGGDASGDAGEAMPVDRMEIHRGSPSPVARSYDMDHDGSHNKGGRSAPPRL